MSSVERQQILTYFSFVTLTTVGYGDITPTHEVTRMFAIMEALCGQLYPATLLARLVSLEVMHRKDSIRWTSASAPHDISVFSMVHLADGRKSFIMNTYVIQPDGVIATICALFTPVRRRAVIQSQ